MSAQDGKNAFARVHKDDENAVERLALALRDLLEPYQGQSVRFVCVGSDRSTGDAYGPLVGTKLIELGLPQEAVFGTLDDPVHAGTLQSEAEYRRLCEHDGVTVAVDAMLGQADNVGTVSLWRSPLEPGTGVGKTLPPVGDVTIVGVVNAGGFMEYFVLQNTQLSVVMKLADLTARALYLATASTFGLGKTERAHLRAV